MKWMKDMVVEGQYHHIVGARGGAGRGLLRVIPGEAGQGLHLPSPRPVTGGKVGADDAGTLHQRTDLLNIGGGEGHVHIHVHGRDHARPHHPQRHLVTRAQADTDMQVITTGAVVACACPNSGRQIGHRVASIFETLETVKAT